MDTVLDGTLIATEVDLHRMLAAAFDLGTYYGGNLAALRDRLSNDLARPIRLVWKHAAQSRLAMGDEKFREVIDLFRDIEKQDIELGFAERFTFVLD